MASGGCVRWNESGGMGLDSPQPVVTFDLDDTLYPERDFALSGYRAVVSALDLPTELASVAFNAMAAALDARGNPFDALAAAVGARIGARDGIRRLVEIYRTHFPDIRLPGPSLDILRWLRASGIATALVTDGRSLTQRNKIAALGLGRFFSPCSIFISEETGHQKPDPDSFRRIMELYGSHRHYIYVGDNPAKDFIAPNILGWTTVALSDRGSNIHRQPLVYGHPSSPDVVIESLSQVRSLLTPDFMEKRKFGIGF